MKIAIASDHAGFDLKKKLKEAFGEVDWLDLGTNDDASVDYADFGYARWGSNHKPTSRQRHCDLWLGHRDFDCCESFPNG